MFINEAFAQTTAAAGNASMTSTIVQLALIFIVFYFLLIRPQQKKMKQHVAMQDAVKVGDKVITGGGIEAKIIKADKDENEMLEAEIANNIVVRISRYTIRDLVQDDKSKASVELKTKKTKAKK